MKRLRLWRLKRRLKKAFRRYEFIRDQFGCGLALAEYISPRLRDAKAEVNAVLGEIRKVDPDNCPEDLPIVQ